MSDNLEAKQPAPLLVRDLAEIISSSVPEIGKAGLELGFAHHSTNMALSPEQAVAIAKHIGNKRRHTSFFAVFFETSTTIPGDERSRTHPGHGYPEHTVTHNEYEEFTDEAALRAWIQREESRGYGRRKYRVVQCVDVEVTTTLNINLTPRR